MAPLVLSLLTATQAASATQASLTEPAVAAQVPAFVALDRSGAPLSESTQATLVSVTTGRTMDAQLKPRPAGSVELTSAARPAWRASPTQAGISGAVAAGLDADVTLVYAGRLTYRRPDEAWSAPGLTLAAARSATFDGGALDALQPDTTRLWLSGSMPIQSRAQLNLGVSAARSEAEARDHLAATARLRVALPGARLTVEGGAALNRAEDDPPRAQTNVAFGAELPLSYGSWVTADVGLTFDPAQNLVTFTQSVDLRWGVSAG